MRSPPGARLAPALVLLAWGAIELVRMAVEPHPAPAEVCAFVARSRIAINLNRAAGHRLQLLPGIGPARAAAIVADRARGAYERLDELERVWGIGPKTVQGLRGLVRLRPGLSRRPSPTATARVPRRDSESHPRPGAPEYAVGDR